MIIAEIVFIEDAKEKERFQFSKFAFVTGVIFRGRLPHRFLGLFPIITLHGFSTMAPMKKQNFTGLLVGLCIGAAPLLGHAQANHVNIMPFGDSVTAFGSNPESSYRYWLWQQLQAAGFNNIDFIGHSSGVADGAPLNGDFDQSYEGGGNDWTSLTALNDADNAGSLNPDIVLLDFGSNDFGEGWETVNASETRSNLDQTIETLRAHNPNVIILLAKPTGWVTTDKAERKFQSALCGAVAKAAQDEKRAGANVILVNLHGGYSPQKDTKDGTHPNVRGEQKIANKYFAALRKILKKM
jgi:acyl-CoA thioesterase-1